MRYRFLTVLILVVTLTGCRQEYVKSEFNEYQFTEAEISGEAIEITKKQGEFSFKNLTDMNLYYEGGDYQVEIWQDDGWYEIPDKNHRPLMSRAYLKSKK